MKAILPAIARGQRRVVGTPSPTPLTLGVNLPTFEASEELARESGMCVERELQSFVEAALHVVSPRGATTIRVRGFDLAAVEAGKNVGGTDTIGARRPFRGAQVGSGRTARENN